MKGQACTAFLALSLVWIVGVQGSLAEQPSQPPDAEGSRQTDESTISGRGAVQSADTLAIRSQVSGQTTILHIVPEGTVVSESDLLVELDDSSLQDELLKRQVTAEKARAALAEAEVESQGLREHGANQLAAAELALKVATLQHDKYVADDGEYAFQLLGVETQITVSSQRLKVAQAMLESILKVNERRPEQVEHARLAVVEANAALEMSQAANKLLTQHTRDCHVAELELAVLEATALLWATKSESTKAVKTADARLYARKRALEVELRNLARRQEQIVACKIHAPRDGVVVYANPEGGLRVIQEGSMVRERQQILLMPDMSRLTLLVRLPESRIESVREGRAAIVRIDAFPDRVFQGAVARVSPIPASEKPRGMNTQEYSVLVSLENPTAELKPGMTATVEIAVGPADKQ